MRTSPNLEENLFAPDCFSNKQHNEINSNNDNDMNHVHSNIGWSLMYTYCNCIYIANYFLKIFHCIFLYVLVVLITIVS